MIPEIANEVISRISDANDSSGKSKADNLRYSFVARYGMTPHLFKEERKYMPAETGVDKFVLHLNALDISPLLHVVNESEFFDGQFEPYTETSAKLSSLMQMLTDCYLPKAAMNGKYVYEAISNEPLALPSIAIAALCRKKGFTRNTWLYQAFRATVSSDDRPMCRISEYIAESFGLGGYDRFLSDVVLTLLKNHGDNEDVRNALMLLISKHPNAVKYGKGKRLFGLNDVWHGDTCENPVVIMLAIAVAHLSGRKMALSAVAFMMFAALHIQTVRSGYGILEESDEYVEKLIGFSRKDFTESVTEKNKVYDKREKCLLFEKPCDASVLWEATRDMCRETVMKTWMEIVCEKTGDNNLWNVGPDKADLYYRKALRRAGEILQTNKALIMDARVKINKQMKEHEEEELFINMFLQKVTIATHDDAIMREVRSENESLKAELEKCRKNDVNTLMKKIEMLTQERNTLLYDLGRRDARIATLEARLDGRNDAEDEEDAYEEETVSEIPVPEEERIPSFDEMVEKLNKLSCVVAGGHIIWQNKLKQLFPDWTFYQPRDYAVLPTSLRTYDKVFMQTKYMSHPLYDTFQALLQKCPEKLAYIPINNIEMSVQMMYMAVAEAV